ncbi:MAG: YeeE/YedE family protein [Sphingomonas sp.]|nr:YeeE/YedE family protein [Sphingomonas sp.]MBW0008166.1 YeeE/YedE family protein [Sphingomonas sp.]
MGLAVAFICATLMGFAIQRGGTCLVAAVDELVSKRRASRLIALGEASLLVAAGIIAAQLLGFLPMAPKAFALTGWTVAGGAIMGLGAYVAGSCVFGAIARIGNGEGAYLLVPVGFFLGCVAALALGMDRLPHPIEAHSLVLGQALLFAGPLALLVGWRLVRTLNAARRGELGSYVWSPHVATGVIGVTFAILLLVVGPWNYTDYLAELARRMPHGGFSRGLLLAALFLGAVLGGWTAGRIKPVFPTMSALVRCLAGGFMLGLGGSLVPGANDGLILLGLPLLYPHALLALASMVVTVSAALFLERHRSAMAQKARLA